MTTRKATERKKMILAMEYIARHVNDEELFWDLWGTYGIPDGEITYGCFDESEVSDYWTEDENYNDIVEVFMSLMELAVKDGLATFDY